MFTGMAEITNLKQFRKQKARADKRRQGDANAARFGVSRADKAAAGTAAEREARLLDSHRIEPAGPRGTDHPE